MGVAKDFKHIIEKLLLTSISSKYRESDLRVRNDEYISWICRIMGGWLSPEDGNIVAFDYSLRNMPEGGAIVEIGSFLGLSTNIISYLTEKYHRSNTLFSCDPWAFEGTERPIGGYFDASSSAYREYAKSIFIMNSALFSEKRIPHAVEAFSDGFFELWQDGVTVVDVFGRSVTLGGPISFAYIDGAHTYQAAKKDFMNIDRNLLPGGFILFDDSGDFGSFVGVRQAAREAALDPGYELVFKTPNYFVRKIH
jgi:hypothetical protein